MQTTHLYYYFAHKSPRKFQQNLKINMRRIYDQLRANVFYK